MNQPNLDQKYSIFGLKLDFFHLQLPNIIQIHQIWLKANEILTKMNDRRNQLNNYIEIY